MADYIKPAVIVTQDFDGIDTQKNTTGQSLSVDVSSFIRNFSKAPAKTSMLYDLFALAAKGDGMGKSAYEIWLDQGNTGTIDEFLESLKGEDGLDGDSAYQIWLSLGNTGDEAAFVQSLVGTEGKSAYDIWIEEGNIGSPAEFLESLKNAGGFNYQFNAQSQVNVTHNLNRNPSVVVTDNNGIVCDVMVTHLSLNIVRINMNSLNSGWVFCN